VGRVVAFLLAVLVAAAAAGAAAPGSSQTGAAGYRFRPVLGNLAGLTYVTGAPGAPRKLYLTQQYGIIRVAVDGKLLKKPFLDLSRETLPRGEMGLLSIAFHPNYARNHLLYVDYNGRDKGSRVVEYRVNAAGTGVVPRSGRQLLLVPQPTGPLSDVHKAGQLAFGPDGFLYVSLGDGQCCDDPAGRAQNMDVLLGKLLRLDVTARPPTPQIVALGLRNPWRFSFDRGTGDLYIADVGAGLWEEIDYQTRAELGQLVNYGWDSWEANAVKEAKEPNPAGKLTFPVYAYDHEAGKCSITGGYVYRGSAVPAARGRYFFGDYCSGEIWSLRVEDGKATDVRREPVTIRGLSTFGEDARGELYAGSERSGRVYKLVP
jgi:glucose/arabinose dehydrogenase